MMKMLLKRIAVEEHVEQTDINTLDDLLERLMKYEDEIRRFSKMFSE